MNKRTTDPGPARPFPEHANLEHLKKEAKQRLKSMRLADSGVKLSAAQFTIAREYGFSSWRSLIAYVKSQPENKVTDFQYSKVKVRQELKSLFDGMEAAGKGDYQTAVANFRHAEMEHPNLTMFEFQRAVTKECGESVWRDLHSYIKSLPAEAQLRPADEDLSTAYNDGLEAARKGDYQTAVEQLR
ncbi:MAG: hypothetical protein J2P31_08645, partial [Blastocatellia bacterium]|nr:hypothetical protein [Blastocatellia bacterium]